MSETKIYKWIVCIKDDDPFNINDKFWKDLNAKIFNYNSSPYRYIEIETDPQTVDILRNKTGIISISRSSKLSVA
jgi:hypothetical protein